MIIDPLQDDKPKVAVGDAEVRGESAGTDGIDISNLNIDDDLPPPSYDAVATFPVPHPQLQSDVQVFYNVPPEDTTPVDVKDRSLFSEEREPRSNLHRSPSAFSAFYSTPGSSGSRPGPSSERLIPNNGPASPGVVLLARPAGETLNFPPLVLHSRSQRLSDGFHAMPPPTDVHPHPFVTCDIREQDWTSFLEAIKNSAAVQSSPATPNANSSSSGSGSGFSRFFNRSKQSLSSSSSSVAFPAVGPTTQANSSSSRTPQNNASLEPGTLVDTWNVQFFRPRGLEIVLARGARRLNGLSSAERARLPPDLDSREHEEHSEGYANPDINSAARGMQQTSQNQPPAPATPGGFTPPPGPPPPDQVLQPHQSPTGPSAGEAQSYYNSRSSHPNQQSPAYHQENDHSGSDSDSDASSDYDSEDERDREAQRALPTPFFNTRAERRAYRQQLRAERHARRAARSDQTHYSRGSRRAERRQERMERKMFRLQQKMARRGYGGPPLMQGGYGYGPGGYAHAGPLAMRGRGGPLGIGPWGRGGMGMHMGRGMGPGPFGLGPGPGYEYGMHGGHMGGGVGFGGPLGLVIKGFEMLMSRADEKGGDKDSRHNSSRDLGAHDSSPSIPGEEGYYRLIVVKFHQ